MMDEKRIAELRALRAILDRRPAINDGLREAYAVWSAEVYAMEAVGEEEDAAQQHGARSAT